LSVADGHELAEEIESKIRQELGSAQIVTHVEPDTEDNLSETPPDGLTEKGKSLRPQTKSDQG
jgi:hypothetical protein